MPLKAFSFGEAQSTVFMASWVRSEIHQTQQGFRLLFSIYLSYLLYLPQEVFIIETNMYKRFKKNPAKWTDIFYDCNYRNVNWIKCVFYFQILDFLSMNDAKANFDIQAQESGFRKICWAFLKVFIFYFNGNIVLKH